VVWGAGGIGKTTLALEVAYRQEWRFPAGILRFPLSGGRTGFTDLLTLYLGTSPGTPVGQLRELLRHGCRLLLLDSFEDAPDRDATEDFLSKLPANGCRALITTRELVTLKNWEVVELPELPPDQALRLFRQLLPSGKWEQDEATEAAAICALLGGHPQALELAAAQGRDFQALDELRTALQSERERLLHDPTLTGVQEKDRNVYYSFSLSYKRLAAQAKAALPRLGVFWTPWSDAGALAVTGLKAQAWPGVRDELRNKSFLRRDADHYWLHPLIQDFSLRYLANAAQVHRCAAAYLEAKGSTEGLMPEEALSLPHHWLAAGDWEGAAKASLTLEEVLSAQGYWEPIRQVLATVLTAVPQTPDTATLRGHLLLAFGRRLYFLAKWNDALASYQQALGLYKAVGARLGEANTLKAIGDVQRFRDEYDAALASYQQALGLYKAVGDRLGEANTLQAIGDVQRFRDEYDAALASYQQALGLYKAVGDRLGEANTLQAIGDVQNFRKEIDAALASYQQALGLYKAVGARLGEANTLQAIGFLMLDTDHAEAGVEDLQQALNLYLTVGDRVGQANIYWGRATRLLQQNALKEAEPLLAQAVTLGQQFAPDHPVIQQWAAVLDQVRQALQQGNTKEG
jgi:tetratricopeptide (TPR) repeat protein